MLGVLLANAGHDVTLLASDRTSTAINTDGLTLRSTLYGEIRARVPARPWLIEPVDFLFVTVKAPDLLAALTRVPAPLLRGAAIAPLLNGVDHVPLLRATFPQATVVPMTVSVEATRVAPGVIEHLSPFADYGISAGHRDKRRRSGGTAPQRGALRRRLRPGRSNAAVAQAVLPRSVRTTHHRDARGSRPGTTGSARSAGRTG
jgi:2-dehydropantoate 2-reductase